MTKTLKKLIILLIAVMIVSLLGGCATPTTSSSDISSETSAPKPPSLERIRYNELSAWSLLKEGGLWIELNNPIRSYRLELQPSCEFALRQAVIIRFMGASAGFIALGDRVVAGRNQCEITGIYEADDGRGVRVSVGKDLE